MSNPPKGTRLRETPLHACVLDVDVLAFVVLYELPPPNETGQESKRRLDRHRGREESLLRHHGTLVPDEDAGTSAAEEAEQGGGAESDAKRMR